MTAGIPAASTQHSPRRGAKPREDADLHLLDVDPATLGPFLQLSMPRGTVQASDPKQQP